MPPSTRLVVVGDSLAAGRIADSPDEAFPQLVAKATNAEPQVLGIPGATTAQLAAQPVPGPGDVVVVEAGTNDVINRTTRAQFAADYRALLAKVTAASPGAKLVCLSVWIPQDAGLPAASSYDATIRRECQDGTVVNVSSLADDPALRAGDGFHPNSAGHAAIAKAIEAKLR